MTGSENSSDGLAKVDHFTSIQQIMCFIYWRPDGKQNKKKKNPETFSQEFKLAAVSAWQSIKHQTVSFILPQLVHTGKKSKYM